MHAATLEKAGRFKEAHRIYEQLIRQHPDSTGILWGLGRCLGEIGHWEGAVAVLWKAVTGTPVTEKMVEDIAARFIALGRPDRCIETCSRFAEEFPQNTNLMIQHGDALRQLGRQPEAIAVFRDLLHRVPGHSGATLSLVNSLRNNKQPDEALELANTALLQDGGPDLNRAGLLNEVAHIADEAGNYDQAFNAFVDSGAMVLQTPQAKAVESDSYQQRLQSYHVWVQSNGLSQGEAGDGSPGAGLVFLLGFPRSGTTLLESILSAAPGVSSSREAPLLGTALEAILESGVTLNNMLDAMRPDNAGLLAEARARYWRKLRSAYGSDHQVFIDKQPLNTLYLAQIRILFPNAKVIFCIRDPRDVCLSCFFQWFALNGTNKLFYDWRATADFYARVMNYWFTLEPLLENSVRQVRHEAFISDFPGQVRSLVDDLGIPWDERILNFAKINRDRQFLTPSNQAVRDGVKTVKKQRWLNYAGALDEVNDLLAPIVERLGYDGVGQYS